MDPDMFDFGIKIVKAIAAVILLVCVVAAGFAGYLFCQWVNGLPAR